MAERIAFPSYRKRIETRIKELGFDSVLALANAKKLQPYQVYRWVKALPAQFEDFVRFAEALEVPWQWIVVGDDIDGLVEFVKTRSERVKSGRSKKRQPR